MYPLLTMSTSLSELSLQTTQFTEIWVLIHISPLNHRGLPASCISNTAESLYYQTEHVLRDSSSTRINVHTLDQTTSGTGTRPNSWSGVSSEVIDVFRQVLALCHNAHDNSQSQRQNHISVSTATASLYDLSLANELQRDLLDMDFDSLILLDEVQGFPSRRKTRIHQQPIYD